MCVVDVNDFIPHSMFTRKSHLTVTLRHTGMPMFIDFASFSTNDNRS